MEALTRAEGSVLLSLLGADPQETERSRIRASGLPRSTYQEAKRRLYQEGYLLNRYIPDPHLVGLQGFRVLVARPFVNELSALARKLEEDRTTVTLWVGPTTLLAVQGVPEKTRGFPPASDLPGTLASVRVTPHPDQLPVFFDLEGTWARVAGAAGPRRYPQGVPHRSLDLGDRAKVPPRVLQGVRDLLARPFGPGLSAREESQLAAPFLPRSQRLALAQGWASWRVLFSLSKKLECEGRELRQLILITGRLKPSVRLRDLTGALAQRTGSCPFLAASDGTQVVLGALGGVGARAEGARGGSVLGTLNARLDDLQVVREDLSTLEARVDLRFDRLVTAVGSGHSP